MKHSNCRISGDSLGDPIPPKGSAVHVDQGIDMMSLIELIRSYSVRMAQRFGEFGCDHAVCGPFRDLLKAAEDCVSGVSVMKMSSVVRYGVIVTE